MNLWICQATKTLIKINNINAPSGGSSHESSKLVERGSTPLRGAILRKSSYEYAFSRSTFDHNYLQSS